MLPSDEHVSRSQSNANSSDSASPGPVDRETTPAENFEQMYAEERPPWDIGEPQPEFVNVADRIRGSVLDVGCGTGENALFFAAQDCEVTGIDLLAAPIAEANRKATERGLRATFLQQNALQLSELNQLFDNVLDCGFFHILSNEDRVRYLSELAQVMEPGSTLYLQCFSDKEPAGEGPRRVSSEELRATFQEGWQVQSIVDCRFVTREDADTHFSEGGPQALFAVIQRG
ncbi:class I SAM-dependent methyltransferase [Gimesia chilikensis]|uniref:class I SAM-dependent methyltransferase n=1 Tax=Gimesia chilikensis TaxID=2605989 RepID=UPI003A94477E